MLLPVLGKTRLPSKSRISQTPAVPATLFVSLQAGGIPRSDSGSHHQCAPSPVTTATRLVDATGMFPGVVRAEKVVYDQFACTSLQAFPFSWQVLC